jgi:hypothetical protein
MSITTNYLTNGTDLGSIFKPFQPVVANQIPSGGGLPNSLYYYYSTINSTGTQLVVIQFSLDNIASIYISYDSGSSWSIPVGPPTSEWTCISGSPSGKYLAVGNFDGNIYISTNNGVNWTATTTLPISGIYGSVSMINSLSINDAGLLLVSASYSTSNGRQLIYYSSDIGITWYLQVLGGSGAIQINACIISNSSTTASNPEFMCCAAMQPGGIWVYNQTTLSWNTTATNFGSMNISISYDGQYAIALLNNETTFCTSSDYCQTWTFYTPNNGYIVDICINSSGNVLYYLASNNNTYYIYISYDFGLNWNFSLQMLNLTGISGNGNMIFITGIGSGSTGCYIVTDNSTQSPLTGYSVINTINDLNTLFAPQLTNPSTYTTTNFLVKNYTPLYAIVPDTYDLGQIFENIQTTQLHAVEIVLASVD